MAGKPTPLTEGPVNGHIRSIALPMSIGFFFNTMYNVVDTYYAGEISREALAAMALSFPVFFIILAASHGISRGASVLIANAIGAGDKKKETELSAQVLTLGVILSAILTVLGLSVARPLFQVLGASGDYLALAEAYITPIFLGTFFFMLGGMSNAILLAHGDSRSFGRVLIVGFFLNLILDPWFLYGGFGLPPMGIAGIAWATVVIQGLSGFYLFSIVLARGHVSMKCRRYLWPNLKSFGEILYQGIPASINMMSIAIGFLVTTYYLKYYGKVAVAAFGIGTRIEQIALLPTIGLSAAVVSIVGQNNGAGHFERSRECVQLCVRYGLILILVASVLIFGFAEKLVGLFTGDAEVIEVGTFYVRVMAVIQWAYVMTAIHVSFLQAVKRPMYGFIEASVRKIVLPLVVFQTVVIALEGELNDFWYSLAAVNVVVTIVTIIYAQMVVGRIAERAIDQGG